MYRPACESKALDGERVAAVGGEQQGAGPSGYVAASWSAARTTRRVLALAAGRAYKKQNLIVQLV